MVTELCHLLQPDLKPQTRTALSVIVNITIVLNFYTNGSFQGATGDISNTFLFAVHCSISKVTDALYRKRRDYISFPMSREKQHKCACDIARIVGFPMVQGAIDCTHVALQAPLHNPEIFCNHKAYHSLNVQLVCDHTRGILTVNARYPGSSHDAFILRQTGVPALFQPPNGARCWLLADKRYLLSTWLMFPLRNPTTPTQHSYNESYAATRNIIEQAIGVLKQWFRCLDRSGGGLQY
uniref:putative nuclease HARBI1 n=1 Tax=Pristiophorus japonicus TaxID=55135 RepID=UPI00398F35B3